MTVTIHRDIYQHTEQWYAIRCGKLTASEMKKVLTPKSLKFAHDGKTTAFLDEITAQRINNYVEPTFQSMAMMRGEADEQDVRKIYDEKYAPVETVGFVSNDKYAYTDDNGKDVGFVLGWSPDGLVGADGAIEVKSRMQKFHLRTILSGEVPFAFMIQLQMALLVSERPWIDFISYCSGMPLRPMRVRADIIIQAKLVEAAQAFYKASDALIAQYDKLLADPTLKFVPTERKIHDFDGEIY